MSAALRPALPMDAGTFLEWPGDGINRLHALIDGEPVAMAPASPGHARLQAELVIAIGLHLRAQRPHCRLAIEAGVQPHARASRNVRIPDIAVSCGPPGARVIEDPLLIIEVLSPSNERETREAVRSCLTIPSLREAVIMHTLARRAEVYRLGEDGIWPAEPIMLEAADELDLTSIGFRHQLGTLYVD